jgi:hypothetical protein
MNNDKKNQNQGQGQGMNQGQQNRKNEQKNDANKDFDQNKQVQHSGNINPDTGKDDSDEELGKTHENDKPIKR